MSDNHKARRGFAAMDPERLREIASKGGSNTPADKRTFSYRRELAVEAGRKGGANVPAEKRAYSRDTELAASSGRKGAAARSIIASTAELGAFLLLLAAGIAAWIGTPA